MASGLAAAGFDYAAARIFIRDGETGLSCPTDRPDELIAAGVRLATDPALRSRLREAGRAAVESQSWEKVIARFERDLEDVAGVEPTPLGPVPVLA
jgi:glycosyltransferase involved in cell wall biosynthesis